MAFLLWSSFLFLSLLRLPIHISGGTTEDDPVHYNSGNCMPATSNTTAEFQANRNLLLSSLSSNATATGYYNDTRGLGPNQVFGLALCRGDVTPTQCGECLAGAAKNVTDACPNSKSAIAWSEWCLLRYANESFFGRWKGFEFSMHNVYSVPDVADFDARLSALVGNLTDRAAASPRMFATGETKYQFSTMYGTAQCTRDLSPSDCKACLKDEISRITSCCGGKQGGVLIGWSCLLRYELYSFYTSDAAAPPPLKAATEGKPPPALTSSAKPSLTTEVKEKTNDNVKIVIPIIVAIAVALAIISIILLLWRKRRQRTMLKGGSGEEIISSESLLFDLTTLKAATNNFSDSNKLGQGGFGPVYKGTLSDRQQIAVKRLSRGSWQGVEELRNEVLLVAKLQHRNLVRLIGYCLGEEEKLLVYEYAPNRSLEKFMNDPIKSKELTWERRQKIVEGIARGLLYLHEDSRLKVIHRDLKASNILLDEELNPKISDFGLAKLFDRHQTEGDTSRIAGTFGYMAPEYVVHGQISTKSDVYSFGVLVLEIVTGRRNMRLRGTGQNEDLLSYVWKHWDEGNALHVLDKKIEVYSREDVLRCIQIGLLCVQDNPETRPNMSTVVLMLISNSMALPTPSSLSYYPCESSVTTKDASQVMGC